MNISFKKLWTDYGIGAIIVLFIVAYGVSLLGNYISTKGMPGSESNASMGQQYKQTNGSGGSKGVRPSEPLGQNEVFASANGVQTSMQVYHLLVLSQILPIHLSYFPKTRIHNGRN